MERIRSSAVVFSAAFTVMVLGLFFALGGLAYAQSATTDQYGQKNAAVTVSAEPEVVVESTESTASAAQTLPNTGLSLLVTALVGALLVAAGVAMRRRERGKS